MGWAVHGSIRYHYMDLTAPHPQGAFNRLLARRYFGKRLVGTETTPRTVKNVSTYKETYETATTGDFGSRSPRSGSRSARASRRPSRSS
ncbi:hypothetical protein P8605_15385 [Streptomyces sp. T-3]|nr:hypothetical protein [Streptomyces sp. T-3]